MRDGLDDDGADRMLAPGFSDDFAVGAHVLGGNELPAAFQSVGRNKSPLPKLRVSIARLERTRV